MQCRESVRAVCGVCSAMVCAVQGECEGCLWSVV